MAGGEETVAAIAGGVCRSDDARVYTPAFISRGRPMKPLVPQEYVQIQNLEWQPFPDAFSEGGIRRGDERSTSLSLRYLLSLSW